MNGEGFLEAVRRTARRYGMDLSRPLALVSGGPDSVALLRVLAELGGKPMVLHVDHGLRGGESCEDAEFVQSLCGELGLVCEVRSLDLGGPNLQEEARRERYRLAEEVAESNGLPTIAVGHTADDVAETVLMNLARGAGLRGLSGIPPVRGPIVRPLIENRRTEVLGYLERLGQPYRTDPTNLTGKYARNRVRLEALPVLEELYPGAGGNIARAASLLREDLEALEILAAGVVHRRGEEVVVPREQLDEMPPALRRHAVRRALSELGAPAPETGNVEAVLALEGEGTRTLDLADGVVAAARPDEIAFYREAEPVLEEREAQPGELDLGGWAIRVREVASFDAEDAARTDVAYLDADSGPYRVRAAREGDKIRPLGLGGTKSVLRAMMDRKVPADLRRRTPVVVDRRGEVAWVCGGELGEGFAVGEGTRRVLRLEVREEGGS